MGTPHFDALFPVLSGIATTGSAHQLTTASTAFPCLQLEEEIQEDLKWCVEVKHVLHSGKSDFQTMELIESGPFGKVRASMAGNAQFTSVTSFWLV